MSHKERSQTPNPVAVESDSHGEMPDSPQYAKDLRVLENKWNSITKVPESPRTTMNVIEYGLGKQRRAEVYVNRLLRYLLDPTEPHQMDAEFLDAFLEGLPADLAFDQDTHDLSDVRVMEQVQINREPAGEGEEAGSPGYVDLFIDVPNEWFLLVELKFAAPETGTEFYSAATEIGGNRIVDYESGTYYLYLHRRDQPEASSETFANWSWRELLEDVLQDFIIENGPRYPQRTLTQLQDLADDLRTIANMSEQSDRDQEKVELYLNHFEAIEDVSAAFDDAWGAHSEDWEAKLADLLEADGYRSEGTTGEGSPIVSIDRGDGESDSWVLRASGGDWQHVFKDGWWIREDDPEESLHTRAGDRNDLRIGFYHRMGTESGHRQRIIRNEELEFNFRCMGSNPTGFRDIYNERFDERREEIRTQLPAENCELTGQKRTMIECSYPINVENYDTFFEAHTAALQDAFIELIVDRPGLIDELTEIFEASVEEWT